MERRAKDAQLGAERSLVKTAEGLGRSTSILERWYKRHNWVERARVYEQHVTAVEQARAAWKSGGETSPELAGGAPALQAGQH
jgi:hypothetical protein